MADEPQIVYTHSLGNSINLFTNNGRFSIAFPNKTIERQPNKVGITVDPNQEYRIVECTAVMSSTDMNTLVGYLMPSSAPTYDSTYPNITMKIDGSTTWTILCAVTGLNAAPLIDGKWSVSIQFTERSA